MRYGYDLHLGSDQLTNLEDTKFMFHVTDLLNRKTGSRNKLVFKVLNDVLERIPANFGSNNCDVCLPR